MRGPEPSCPTGKSTWIKPAGLFICAILWLGPALSAEPAATSDRTCHEATAPFSGTVGLPRTAQALHDGKPLTVVALGSSSTQGFGSTAPEKAYPAQLQTILSQRFPRSAIKVLNRGVGGDTADRMLGRLNRDVFAANPDLVIWQTGTNDALRQLDPDQFQAILNVGVRVMLSRGLDLVLMTPQFAPRYVAAPNYHAFIDRMEMVAADRRIALFRRFELTKSWAEDSRFRAVQLTATDGLHPTDASYRCVAVLLADQLARAAASGN